MFEKQLERIGLSKAEVTLYLALVRLGSSPTAAIVNESGLRKSTVYECLNRLLEKGLVSYVIKHKIKFFEAADPERLLDFLEEKKRELEENEAEVKEILPKLESLRSPLKPHAEAHVFFGVEGFKTMRRDALKHAKGELLMLGAISREPAVMPIFWSYFNKERLKRGIKMRLLHQRNTNEKPVRTESYAVRFLPEEIKIPAVINVYGDRVVSLLWKGDYPICFMLINGEISDAYRKYFEILWKQASKSK